MSSATTNRMRPLVLLAVGSVVGIAATLAVLSSFNTLTRDSANKHLANSPTPVDEISSPGDKTRSSSSTSSERHTDLGYLRFLVEAPSAFARMEALYSLLLSADEKLLTTLLEQSENIGLETLQHSTQTAIVQRFTAVNPILALSAIDDLPSHRHKSLISAVFGEWTLVDLDEAVAHVKTLEEFKKQAALQGILRSQNRLSQDIKEGIANAFQIDVSDFAKDTSIIAVADEWQELIDDEQPNLGQAAQLIRLAHEWVGRSGLSAIALIDTSLNDSTLKKAVLGSVLQRAMLVDPDSTLQQALEFEDNLRELALETIARAWVSISPQDAMVSISTIEAHRVRRQMLDHFVTAWASIDPKGMFNNFDLIPENLRSQAEEHAIRTIARTTPEDAVKFLADVSDEYLKFDLTMEIATNWADQDTLAALNWVLSEQFSSASLERLVLSTVLSRLAEENAGLALQTALDQPLDLMGLGLEATVIEAMARTDLERAISVLSQVREGWTQSSSYVAVGKALVRNNEIDRAIELAQQLPEENRDLYYNLVVNEWAYSDPKSLVSELENLPSQEAKFTAAMDLTRINVGTNVLTQDQMSFVRRFLPKDYNSDTGRRGAESARYARLNSMRDKDLTDEERAQIQKDFQKMLMEGRYKISRQSSQSLR